MFQPSGFAFARDARGRRFLWGVDEEEVRRNSFFDGPFDQVPPDLSLRTLLLDVYPGLDGAPGGPIDLHGNWTGREGVRVAISPYREYAAGDLLELAGRVPSGVSPGLGWSTAEPERMAEARARRVKELARDWPWGHDLDRSQCDR